MGSVGGVDARGASMKWRATMPIAACWLALATAGTSAQVYRSAVTVVSVDAVVTSRNTSVTGLRAADFELRDNGVVQRVELGGAEPVPIDVTVLVGASTTQVLGARLDSGLRQLRRRLRPDDRIRLVSFGTDIRESVPLGRAISWPDGSLPEIVRRAHGTEGPRPERGLVGAALFDALIYALASPRDAHRRELVIPFVDQGDSGSAMADAEVAALAAARAGILVEVAFLNGRTQGQPFDSTPGQYVRRGLEEAARVTGGSTHDASTEGWDGFAKIFDGLRSRYRLQFTPTGVGAPGWHSLSVTVPAHPDYVVRARAGYLAAPR